MSQQQRLIQLPLIGAVILCLLVGVYLLASRRFSKSHRSTAIRRHSVETPSDETLRYWTADKKRHAKPVDLPNVTALNREKPHPRGPSN